MIWAQLLNRLSHHLIHVWSDTSMPLQKRSSFLLSNMRYQSQDVAYLFLSNLSVYTQTSLTCSMKLTIESMNTLKMDFRRTNGWEHCGDELLSIDPTWTWTGRDKQHFCGDEQTRCKLVLPTPPRIWEVIYLVLIADLLNSWLSGSRFRCSWCIWIRIKTWKRGWYVVLPPPW